MPPISDQKRINQPMKTAGLPDRDNPLAWKRATREGKLGARDLLTTLTDDEVARYLSVVEDQIKLEERGAWLKIASAIAGAALLGFLTWYGLDAGFGGWVIAGLGLGLVMEYWPWRVMKCRQLWQTHFKAARDEQARRALIA
jgi:hypothetical protein